MVDRFAALLGLLLVAFCAAAAGPAPYYPDRDWQHKAPAEAGIDAAKLKEAVDFAIKAESHAPRDLVLNHYQTFGREPFGYAIGPIQERGDPTGVVVYHGYIVAEWGEPKRVDMTHSVSKSFLSSVIGVAYDRGMIRSLDDPVGDYVGPIVPWRPAAGDKSDRMGASDEIRLFDTPHNKLITWDHMLRQTSNWEPGAPTRAGLPNIPLSCWRIHEGVTPVGRRPMSTSAGLTTYEAPAKPARYGNSWGVR